MAQVTNKKDASRARKSTGKAKGSAKRGQTEKRGAAGMDSAKPETGLIRPPVGARVLAWLLGEGHDADVVETTKTGCFIRTREIVEGEHSVFGVPWDCIQVNAKQDAVVLSAPRTRTITLAPGTEVTAMIAGNGRDAVISEVGIEGAWVQIKPGFRSPEERQFVAWEDLSVCADQGTGGEGESQAASAVAMDTPKASAGQLRIVGEIADMLIVQPEPWLEGYAFRLRGALQERAEPAIYDESEEEDEPCWRCGR